MLDATAQQVMRMALKQCGLELAGNDDNNSEQWCGTVDSIRMLAACSK